MQETDNNRNRLDDFSQLFKDKLEDYRLPPEDTDWQAMERLLASRKHTRRKQLWMVGAGIAAAITTLLFVLLPGIKEVSYEEEITGFSIEKYIEEIQQPVTPNIPEQPVITAKPASRAVVAQSRGIISSSSTPDTGSTEAIQLESRTFTDQTEEASANEEEAISTSAKKSEQEFYAFNEYNNPYIPATKRKRKWQISTGLATGGNLQLKGLGGGMIMQLLPVEI